MKHLRLAAFLLAAAVPAAAYAGPFDGTWRLDTARSRFTGDTFTYARTADGYSYSNGSTVNFTFAIDGREYPTIPSRTTAWTRAADGGWDVVTRGNGKVVSRSHRALSPDGRTMTSDYTEYRADGTIARESDVYSRVSGGRGLAGEWRNIRAQVATDIMNIATSPGGRFEINQPSMRETTSGRTDGAPAAIRGPTVPPGATASYREDGPRRWTYAIMLDGKTYARGAMTVSADGNTLTDSSWVPGKPSEIASAVYIRR